MALTAADLHLWSTLKTMGVLPAAPALLEVGQANLWMDVPPAEIPALADAVAAGVTCPFALAEAYYDRTLGCVRKVAIDLHGTERAWKLDLNRPIALSLRDYWLDFGKRFDIVVNSGTAEHVFNQYQLFATIHNCTVPGGLMVHAAPLAGHGWPDHGFYAYNPTFFRDLAAANGYDSLLTFWWHVASGEMSSGPGWPPPGDAMIYVALRKTGDGAFRVPRQGRYS